MNRLVLLDGNKISGGINYITPECYSTEEREVGCWTDGKPLYERTFDLGSDTDISYNSWTETTISWQTISVDRLVGAKGFTSSGGTFAGTLLASKKSNGKVEIQTPRNNYNSGVRYLTLQYTKSTDTAGSGTWTPSGIPAVHYSTEEHVVGTWIDGSTLYEKTFDLGSDLVVPYNTWIELGITLDAEKIILSQATATVGSFQGNILVYYDSTANKWKGQSPRNTDGSWVRYLTLQYTKASS